MDIEILTLDDLRSTKAIQDEEGGEELNNMVAPDDD